MGLTIVDPVAYGKLLATELPKTIESNEEFDRVVERLEALDFADRTLTAEETALRALLAVLIKDYDDNHFEIPYQPPHEVLQFLMEQRNLKQADLISLLGTRAQVSDAVTGRRGISKAQAKKLAAHFHVSAELFL
jgi:HTH-type transcriptional regulator / antitoxin HigA